MGAKCFTKSVSLAILVMILVVVNGTSICNCGVDDGALGLLVNLFVIYCETCDVCDIYIYVTFVIYM